MPTKKKTTTKKAASKKTGRYPKGVVVQPHQCDLGRLKKLYGGSLPDIKGRKTRYPAPSDEQGWRKCYAEALTYKNKERHCRLNNFHPPSCTKKYKHEYLLFHGRPDKKQDRASRNRDRKKHGLKKGDKTVVHHTDPNDMSTKKTVKLTHCQHQRLHGKKCKSDK